MSLAGVVEQVGQVLGRAHALFGAPEVSGAGRAGVAGRDLATGAQWVRSAGAAMASQSGAGPRDYRGFAAGAEAELESLAGEDDRLGGHLGDAATADRAGRADSGRVLDAAATDVAAIAPATATPAGQQALLKALRQRVSEQQQVVAAYQARDARMAALVRALAYQRLNPGAPMTSGTAPAPGGVGPAAGLGGAPLGAAAAPLSSLVGGLAAAPQQMVEPPRPVGGGSGHQAAEAALSRRGAPYVWGAKGPSRFDCSGLTSWAWRQAGVELGPDTYTQFQQGIAVPPDQVRAGDLIFPLDSFGEGGRPGPGHVQLAIGGGQVVHAPQTGDVVRIAALPDRFIARRPIPTVS